MGMFRKFDVYPIETIVWESMHPEITPLKNHDNIGKYEPNWMA